MPLLRLSPHVGRSLLAAIASLLPLLAPEASAQKHPFSVDDMLAMKRISSPAVSPDGRRVAFVVRETEVDADRGRTDLWLVGTRGTVHRATRADDAPGGGPLTDLVPRDGRFLYFLSSRSGSSQVWRLRLSGVESRDRSPTCRSTSPTRSCHRTDAGWPSPPRSFPTAAACAARPTASRSGEDSKETGSRLRAALLSPLGHLRGRPTLSPLHARPRRRRRGVRPADRRHGGSARRRTAHALRRCRGDRLQPRLAAPRLCVPRRRRARVVVDQTSTSGRCQQPAASSRPT